MKKLTILMAALLLASCTKATPEEIAASELRRAAQTRIESTTLEVESEHVITTDHYYEVRKICIDKVWYLMYQKTITVQLNQNGQPRGCE